MKVEVILCCLLLFGFLSVCRAGQERVSSKDVFRIDIPKREHGYSNLEDIEIRSQSDMENFIGNVKDQENWNRKEKFVSVLAGENVQYSSHYVAIFTHKERSGSVKVELADPVWENGVVVINIRRDAPTIVTHDMAYYAFAYKVRKRIEIHINGKLE